MDIYVEKQCVEKLVSGELRQFLNLYDANFAELYKYVRRRINDPVSIERIVRLTFLEAIALYKESPRDFSYVVWLFSLAKKRVNAFLEANQSYRFNFSEIIDLQKNPRNVEKVISMFGKLRIEESEIIKLKFFEQVSDSDIMIILDLNPQDLGSRIYRVLKRAHFLLFGETDENQGVYFGELAGLLASFLENEKINSPEALRLTFKSQLSQKIDNSELILDPELMKEMKEQEEIRKNREDLIRANTNKGSKDPAKVFVDAAASFNEEEKKRAYVDYQHKKEVEEELTSQERVDNFWEIFDSIKGILFFVPVFIFLIVVSGLFFFWYWPNISGCNFDVVYNENLSEEEIKDLRKKIANPVCKHFDDVLAMEISDVEGDKVNVVVERKEYSLKYVFDTRGTEKWFVKMFEKELISMD